ncbi:MAG TPA: DEAD/DEAH box helicase [Alphaproteobacteria bacterium]
MTISFSELSLRNELQTALRAQGYETPTPIQAKAIPHALTGRDVIGLAQTGTGKTAAFTLPLLQRLAATPANGQPGRPRALILTPTRELALQIGESLTAYGAGLRLRHAVIFGGVGQQPQVEALRRRPDVLVATPGRLLDLMNQRHVRLDGIGIFVLDEADRMLDMGFIHDVRRITGQLPKTRQTLFFSATMPREISDLAAQLLRDPVRVEVAPAATTVDRVDQRVMFVAGADKRRLLVDVLGDRAMTRVIVFTRTKRGADKVARYLEMAGIAVASIHGNKSQGARQAALEAFRNGKTRVLVATDIAARGIDVDGVSHVVNYELPNVPESYVHRIGRTARAGADGIALSFCDQDERIYLRDIEKLIRKRLTVIGPPAGDGSIAASPDARPPQPPARTRAARHDAPPRKAGQRRGGSPRPARAEPPRRDRSTGQFRDFILAFSGGRGR